MEFKQRINVSGYRGIWGESLSKEVVILYTRAFVSFLKEKKEHPTILIGRDGRESGPEIREIILNELRNLKVEAVDGDILPTPTVLFSVRKHGYDGAIIITASHNPIEYNGIKFVNDQALFTVNEEVEKINKYYEEEIKEFERIQEENIASGSITEDDGPSTSKKPSKVLLRADGSNILLENPDNEPSENFSKTISNFLKEHADKILENINVEAIRAKKFKVAVDMINASACVMDPYLFEQLGVEVYPLNNIPNGKFGHRPEPLRENLGDIEKLVIEKGADVGFVHDPDADRLVVVSDEGIVESEENSIALVIENVLSKHKGLPIVLNLSTSQRGADIAKKYGSETFRTKIGEGFVVEGMLAHNAILSGEGNGGIIYPTINTCRDSFVGLSLILELMAERNKTISTLMDELPKYIIKKDKWPLGSDLNQMYIKLKDYFKDATYDEQDGLRLDLPDSSWLHLRPSNTEPIIKLFGEAKTQERIDELFEETKKVIF
ncbi:MAG: phosphoglucosamine mutase [Candidatus Paceibacterota bacterium]